MLRIGKSTGLIWAKAGNLEVQLHYETFRGNLPGALVGHLCTDVLVGSMQQCHHLGQKICFFVEKRYRMLIKNLLKRCY